MTDREAVGWLSPRTRLFVALSLAFSVVSLFLLFEFVVYRDSAILALFELAETLGVGANAAFVVSVAVGFGVSYLLVSRSR